MIGQSLAPVPAAWPSGGTVTFTIADFVTMRGGEYFYAPSMTFLRGLASAPTDGDQTLSYLSTPRFHFAGTYLADPSTVNNDAVNVAGADVAEPDAIAAFRGRAWAVTAATTAWNPNGNHTFSFRNVTVRSAVGSDGEPVDRGSRRGADHDHAGRLAGQAR